LFVPGAATRRQWLPTPIPGTFLAPFAQTLNGYQASIRAFAGEHVERAVVEPEAAAVLTRFDQEVRHYEVMAGPND